MRPIVQGPKSVAGLLACADACYDRGDVRGRLKYFERVARAIPENYVIRSWVAECRLALGEWTPVVWRNFEYHYLAEQWADYYHHVATQVPRWTGQEPLDGKTLFVLLDGGFGDVFQNYRYTSWLEKGGARVLWQVRASQAGLCPGFTEEGYALENEIDYFVACGSLPGAFGTVPETIPLPYRVPGLPWWGDWPPRRVAVCSQGNSAYRAERYRSLPERFAWLDLPCSWVELPTGGDWRETANILRRCDLCITVDTAVAHLAGSLGLPTWLLLSVRSDWRWLRDRAETAWYPTMTILRQQKLNDWADVLARVRARLIEALDGAASIA